MLWPLMGLSTLRETRPLRTFDYGGFLLDGCAQKSRDNLQKLQNKALRTVNGYNLANSPSTELLHNMSFILSLRQRWEKQMLHLMLWYSKSEKNVIKKKRATRTQEKINFKVLPLKTHRYIHSPMNRGNILWNNLSKDEQFTFSNSLFKLIIDKRYKVYRK